MVEIRIEPFVPVIVPGQNSEQSIFRGQVFMLRRVQIEDKSYLQGFQLNEKKLLEEVDESAKKFIRDDMDFDLDMTQSEPSAYTAILDFAGLGHLMLNLTETDPAWIGRQIHQLRTWYLGIMSLVFLAVTLALGSLWLSARAQLKLAQKKDDFISAVSHELRTPLTSIRMHAEMLEKNWVKSEGKLTEYYKNMRQESERLSRLIENVLDFSRIQRGRKKYIFKAGDINKYVEDVVEMMTPYATQKGFSIKTELSQTGEITFDGDAVTQIVVNLLDNAIKYARNATDKTITIRTKSDNQYTIIEVEDHGPGIPHSQREKIFQEFYRIGAEATRETAGSGLGLALVKKFVQAHNGFVEITNARPNGVIFRAALSAQM
jgi:signal transduction histidine kinase